jgi:S1-C subfamily serine protease
VPVLRLVRVNTSGCSPTTEISTGFIVRPGLVVTVAHALHDATKVTVEGKPAKVLAVDERMDAALLGIDDSPDRRVEFAEPNTPEAVRIMRWNHDRVQRLDATITALATIDFSDLRLHTEYLRSGFLIDKESRPGDSGAPILNADGRVVGMLFASSVNDPPQATALVASEIRALVAAGPSAAAWVGSCG